MMKGLADLRLADRVRSIAFSVRENRHGESEASQYGVPILSSPSGQRCFPFLLFTVRRNATTSGIPEMFVSITTPTMHFPLCEHDQRIRVFPFFWIGQKFRTIHYFAFEPPKTRSECSHMTGDTGALTSLYSLKRTCSPICSRLRKGRQKLVSLLP